MVEAFLDYVDGGRQVGLDPALVRSDSFRGCCAAWWTRSAMGVFAQEPTACECATFKVVCGPTPRSSAGGSSSSAMRASSRCCGPGHHVTFIPVDQDARERARRDHGTSLVRKRGRARARPLSSATAEQIGRSGAARWTRSPPHVHGERRHHDKLLPAERLERARSDTDAPRTSGGARRGLECTRARAVSTLHARVHACSRRGR